MTFDPYILCGRHPEAYKSPSTIYARHVVEQYLPAYIQQRELCSSRGKGIILDLIVEEIRSGGYRTFYKKERGELVVMSKKEIRLAIGHWLRDALKRSQRSGAAAAAKKKANSKGCGEGQVHSTLKTLQAAQLETQDNFVKQNDGVVQSGFQSQSLVSETQSVAETLVFPQTSPPPPSFNGEPSHSSLRFIADTVTASTNTNNHNHHQELLQSLETGNEASMDAWSKHVSHMNDVDDMPTYPTTFNLPDSFVGEMCFKNENEEAGFANVIAATNSALLSSQLPSVNERSVCKSLPLGQSDPVIDAQDKEQDLTSTLLYGDRPPHRQGDGSVTCNNNNTSDVQGVRCAFDKIDVDTLSEPCRS